LERRIQVGSTQAPGRAWQLVALHQSLAKQHVKPAVGTGVDVKLELRRKRKLIVFRVDTELHSGMRRKQQLEAGERIAHVRQCQVCAMPRATGANIVYRNVHRRRELLRKSMKELHHSFGI